MRGQDQFAVAWRLTAGGWAACALLQLILYLRPSPYGGPFLLEWKAFILRPLAYELLSTWLIALPFLLLWLVLYRRPATARGTHWALAALIAANLLITAFDHELYRFLGLRLGPNFLAVYADPTTLADSLFLNILARDRGGPFISPILCLAAPSIFGWWAARQIRRERLHSPAPALGWAWAILLAPLATGLAAYSLAHAKFRLSRLEPALFAIVRDYAWRYQDDDPPGDPVALGRAWQTEWLAGSGDRGWRFPDPDRPFIREPVDPTRPRVAARWNILIVQMESVRGVDTGHLRPDRTPSPTPYLDSLAARPDSAAWTRGLTFGPPSINGRFALQCSVTPSSRRFITSQTRTSFYCLSDALRRLGYRTEMFSAGDIDMDNSTIWVQRMYDRLWRYPREGQRDRPIFRHAASRIRELGRSGPFLATLISATNHHPFHSPEPELDIAGHGSVRERILNTARYTDDVVRELVESLRAEPWFKRTLVVVVSDHGYNLGEHGGLTGAYRLNRESVWTPFLIVGPHPRLPVGRHEGIVTLLDIAPTIADLIGLRERNPWQGHSLLMAAPDRSIRFGFRDSLLAETGGWSAVTDPGNGRPRLFDSRSDWLQRRDLSARHPAVAEHLLAAADRDRRFNDYILRHGKLWRPEP
jgi:hypothetical protein